MITITVLGATGSIGSQTLNIVRKNPKRFKVIGLSAGKNISQLESLKQEFKAEAIALGAEESATLVKAHPADVVINGITGSIGLKASIAALEAKSKLALANKESLVAGSELIKKIAQKDQIIPVDSEHSAIAQALRSGKKNEVKKLILTASGGPFKNHTKEQLFHVTPTEALKHPTWNMGMMVTTNSATLVNKGLEVIEAHLLFDMPYDDIEVVIHPQSIIHSMVEFHDGSTIAQISPPDMHLPISLGMLWPERLANTIKAYDWTKRSTWTFEPVNYELFESITIAKEAGKKSGYYPAIFNASNEEAVFAFHDEKIKFTEITEIIKEVLSVYDPPEKVESIDELLFVENDVRRISNKIINNKL